MIIPTIRFGVIYFVTPLLMETLTNWINSRSKTERLIDVMQWPIILMLSMWPLYPNLLHDIIYYNSSIAVKAACMILVFYYGQEIFWSIREFIESVQKIKLPVRVLPGRQTGNILNTETDKIVNFILQNNGLPTELAKKALGLSGERCKEIGDILKNYKIMDKDKADCNRWKLIERDPYVIWFALNYHKDTTEPIEALQEIE